MGNLMEHFFLSRRKVFPFIHSHLFSFKIKRYHRILLGFGQNSGLKRDTARPWVTQFFSSWKNRVYQNQCIMRLVETQKICAKSDLGLTFPHFVFLSLFIDTFDQNLHFLWKHFNFDQTYLNIVSTFWVFETIFRYVWYKHSLKNSKCGDYI